MSNPYLLSYSLEDETGRVEQAVIPFNSTDTLANITTEAGVIAPLLDAVTGAKLARSHIIVPIALPGGLKTDPTATYRLSHGALLRFSVTGSKYSMALRIGAYLNTLFSGKEVPNLGATAALVTELLTTSTAGTTVNNHFDEDIAAFISGRESVRKPRGR